MRGVNQEQKSRRAVAIIVVIVAIVVVVSAVLCLTASIDRKLNQSAEQQVVTFTEQAAASISERVLLIQNVIGAFSVQTSDPADVVPSLAALKERMGFADVAFVDMDGAGYDASGRSFSVDNLTQEETALSGSDASYSETFLNDAGVRVRLAQQPVYLDGQQVGALYVQIPLSMFTMPDHLEMFDGCGYFILLDSSSGEILAPPTEDTKTPIDNGDTLYEFLDAASLYEVPSSSVPNAVYDALISLRTRPMGDLRDVPAIVASGSNGLLSAMVDGKASYVCVAPVGAGYWYLCSVVPVENVRAEADVVIATFQGIFGIVVGCLIIVGVMGFVAYRRRVQERNVSSLSQLYRALSDSVDLAVNMYDPSTGKVMPIVAKAANIIGFPLKEFLENPQLDDKIGLSPEGKALFDRVRTGQLLAIEKGEFSFCDPSLDKVRWVAYSVKPLAFEETDQVFIVLRDSTSEKEIQLSMKDAMDAAETANQAKSEFLSRMSHEIRTPMNVIIGMLQIARSNVDDCAKMRTSLQKIGAASDHLLGLINDVLDLSKIESGKMTMASEPFRLGDILLQVVGVIRPQCEQRHQQLDVKTSKDVGGVYVGDAVRVKQLLINLLSNSVKYTQQGGRVRLEASVSSASVMGYRQIEFIVKDDGIGMSEDFVGHLFEPFVMEGRSREQGTGLGMSIVKNIVSMMGGTINVQSTEGEGTTFRVVVNLRVAFDAERKLLEEVEKTRHASGAQDEVSLMDYEFPSRTSREADGTALNLGPLGEARTFERSELEGLRVLVAEDNELNAEIAIELLSESGLTVERACDGEEARAMFDASEEGYYDAILMDVQMPRLNGYEATRAIRALDRDDALTVPIIAMSANAFSEDVSASLASGMNAHLSKPIEVRRVLGTIVQFSRLRANGPGGDGDSNMPTA